MTPLDDISCDRVKGVSGKKDHDSDEDTWREQGRVAEDGGKEGKKEAGKDECIE